MEQGCPRLSRLGATRFAALIPPLLLTAALCALTASACVAGDPSPQFTNISPLPGGGIAIDADGRPDGLGAFQVNIPVAYTPGWGFANLSVYEGAYSNSNHDPFGNGTGLLGAGFGSWPRVYMSVMQVSKVWHESKALSGQALVAFEKPKTPALAVGVQDFLMKEDNGRSFYGVATRQLSVRGHSLFATFGFGSGRFLNRPFAGVSAPLGDHFNAAFEWDGFQINTGVGWRPAGRRGALTALLAFNGRSGWLVGAAVAANFGSK